MAVVEKALISEKSLPEEVGLQAAAQYLILHKLDNLKVDFAIKSKELKERQEDVRWLHDLMQKVNKMVDRETGELDLSHPKIDPATGLLKQGMSVDDDEQLQAILEVRAQIREAAEQKGCHIKNREKYSKDDRERMLDNLRLSCEDLNLQNDMQLQDLNQMINERYEVYQVAKTIMKALHDHTLSSARAISGR